MHTYIWREQFIKLMIWKFFHHRIPQFIISTLKINEFRLKDGIYYFISLILNLIWIHTFVWYMRSLMYNFQMYDELFLSSLNFNFHQHVFKKENFMCAHMFHLKCSRYFSIALLLVTFLPHSFFIHYSLQRWIAPFR